MSDIEMFVSELRELFEYGSSNSDVIQYLENWQAARAQGDAEPVGESRALPCPFCGELPHQTPHSDPTYPQIECLNLECPIGMIGEEVSLESWNKRAYTHPPAAKVPGYVGWYCEHCQRGVDGSEVTFNEQHQECGRVITNDEPPTPQPDKWIPEGWKLVPVEPTDEMQASGGGSIRFDTTVLNKIWSANAVYRAMVETAPAPPKQESE